MFAVYKITSLGEEQVKGEGEVEREASVGAGAEENGEAIAGVEEFECTGCGTTVREDEIECPQCGMIFEGFVEEILDHPSVPEEWKSCNWKWK